MKVTDGQNGPATLHIGFNLLGFTIYVAKIK